MNEMSMAAPSTPKALSKLGQVPSFLGQGVNNLGQSALDVGSLLRRMPSIYLWQPHLKILVSALPV